MCIQIGLSAYPFVSFGSRKCRWFEIRKAFFARKNKIPCRSVESRNCTPQNVDLAMMLTYQGDRAGIKVYSESQSCLSKRDEYSQGCTRSATDYLPPNSYTYGSIRRTYNV